MIDRATALLLRGLVRALGRVPAPLAARLEALGDLFHEAIPIRRAEMRAAILASDLALPARRIDPLIRQVYRHQILNLVEFIRIGRLAPDRLDEIFTFRGLEHFDRALAAGRGVVLLTAHFGNWEYLGAALAHRGYPLRSIVRKQGGAFDAEINRLRGLSGHVVFDRNRSGRRILQYLKENAIVGMAADQHSDNAGVRLEFLGRPCMATAAPVAFALKSGAALIPAFDLRVGFERHDVIVLPPIGLERTGDRDRDLAENTRRAQKAIEAMVRRHPEQWFWFHKRWRA